MSDAHPHFAHPHEAFTAGFYRNRDFDFDVRIALGGAASGSTDVGEILSAIATVGEKDHEGWFRAWLGLGDRIRGLADASAAAGHRVSASAAYLRAASYYATAVNAVDGLKTADALLPTFRRHRAAWDRFVDTTAVPVERVELPYESGTSLPGYFFSPPMPLAAGPRPTLLMVNGSDGPISGLWGSGAFGALGRGYNVLLFDGPGQQTMLFERGVPFRPDFEAVVTPIVDYLLGRGDVDADRLAVYGISQAGYWVPRALAFEHRFAAAIADPGVVDVSTSWTAHLPKGMRQLLESGQKEKFDREMALGMRFSGDAARTWAFRARPFLRDGYFDTLSEVLRYRLDAADAARITTPLLITAPEDEQFWPGQSQRLAELVGDDAVVVPFTAAEGASAHCEPMARTLADQRMFDWLDERLGLSGPPA